MKLKSLGTVIATRKLALSGKYVITVKIGKPKKFPDKSGDYYCPYQIRGIGDGKIKYAAGVDAVQALILALQGIGTALYTSNEYEAGALCLYPGDNSRDLDFPVPHTIKDFYPAKK